MSECPNGSPAYVGPIPVSIGNHRPSWSGTPANGAVRGFRIDGTIENPAQARQLQELVTNPHRRVTLGPVSGVLEPIWGSGGYADLNGWYLLQSVDVALGVGGDYEFGWGPFTLDAVLIGVGDVVVVRRARDKSSAFGVTAKGTAVVPFRGDDAGEQFADDPGGTFLVREFAPAHPLDPRDATPDTAELGLYVGGVDVIDLVCIPRLASIRSSTPPPWVTDRGGDVRAWDRREGQEVYGPAHPFRVPSDVALTNGILRLTCGARGIVAYLTVEALVGGRWRDVGHLLLAEPLSDGRLLDAALTRVTPDSATLTVVVAGQGKSDVTLRRGEPIIRVDCGTPRSPSVVAQRRLRWQGIPPQVWAGGLTLGSGRWGGGLRVADGGDAELQWPRDVASSDWTVAFWWLADHASTGASAQPDSGLAGVQQLDGEQVGEARFETSDDNIRWTQAGNVLASGGLSWAAGEPVFVALRFSSASGMAMTTKDGTTVRHVSAPAFVDPGTLDDTFRSLMLGSVSLDCFSCSPFSSLPFASTLYAGGTFSDAMVFEDALTDAECAALANAADRLAGLPSIEGRLAWYAPLSSVPMPGGSPAPTGVTYQATADGGATRQADGAGITRGLAAVEWAGKVGGLGLATGIQSREELAAVLALSESGSDLADLQSQFTAETVQETRIR